jgi:3-hydroxyisobutyrate dehydrogenase-like beta-hydroxyacid dehydrogenase
VRNLNLGLIGFGEVGFTFAKGIRDNPKIECKVFAFDSNTMNEQGALIKKRAQDTSVHLVKSLSDLTNECEVILGLIPSSHCIKVAWQVADLLKHGQIYCDLSASSPHMKREAGEMVNAEKGSYVDGSIMGSMLTYGFLVPIYLSGSKAESISLEMNSLGFQTRVISNEVGTASAVKLLRSSFTKGIEALIIETFYTASLYKAEDIILETLSDTFDKETFHESVNRYLTSSVIHADRRVVEAESVIELLREKGVEPYMALASQKRLSWLAKKELRKKFQDITPNDYHQVLVELLNNP